MSAVIDQHTGQRDHGLERDAALERQIDEAFRQMQKSSANDEESNRWWTQIAVLIRRRSTTQLLKLERRMRARSES